MKRIILVASLALILCLAMVVPVQATDPQPQTWFLQNIPFNGSLEMIKGTHGGAGTTVSIPVGGYKLWLANQAAADNVTFAGSTTEWPLSVGTQVKWGSTAASVVVGEWSQADGFQRFNGYSYRWGPTSDDQHWDIFFSFTMDPTVPKGHYLAVKLINNTQSDLVVKTDSSSYLMSPDSDPGYPLPEMVTGGMLAIGLAGLGGYFFFQRRSTKASHKKV
jgi:hypothetical protein